MVYSTKGNTKKVFAYEAHTACDKHNFILGVHVTSGKVYTEHQTRKEKIERVFADAKEKHSMRYAQYRGLTQVTNWVKLKFATMNLKKLAAWKWKQRNSSPDKERRGIFLANLLFLRLFFPLEMKSSSQFNR